MKSSGGMLWSAVLTVLLLSLSTLVGALLQHWQLHQTNVVMVYILSVLLISRLTRGYLCGILASVASILLFNWFFTEPYFTLKVNDMTYLITFAIMMLTSVMTSALTTKVKKAAEQAWARERESKALYRMTNQLTDAEDGAAIATIVVTIAGEMLHCQTACICFDDQGEPESTYLQRRQDGVVLRRELTDGRALRSRMEKLHSTAEITDEHYEYPIYARSGILAVLRLPREVAETLTEDQNSLLHSIIESAALALERLRSLQEQAKSREETAQERYRANLLRAISHDIRTPLSGILGTGEMLMSTTDPEDPRYGLARDVYRDAQWLHDMVENILNLTKLRDGGMTLHKQPEAVEEVVGATLLVMEKRLPGRTIDVDMPDTVVMAPMEARLISQVLINLLDNAHKHSQPGKPISLSVTADADTVSITVADRGSGIREYDLPHIFQMFYTTRSGSPDSRRGVGLGLAICQSIVEAHGGTIRAENRAEGGAAFTFTLPIKEAPWSQQTKPS